MSLKDLWNSFISNDPVGKALGASRTPGTPPPATAEGELASETDAERKRRQDDQDFTQSGFPGAV